MFSYYRIHSFYVFMYILQPTATLTEKGSVSLNLSITYKEENDICRKRKNMIWLIVSRKNMIAYMYLAKEKIAYI